MNQSLGHIRVNRGEGTRTVYVYAASREACQACCMRNRCTPNNKTKKHGRAVSIALEDGRVEAFLMKMKAAEVKVIYKQRAPIAEFPNAWIKTTLHWARARFRSLQRASVEAIWPALT